MLSRKADQLTFDTKVIECVCKLWQYLKLSYFSGILILVISAIGLVIAKFNIR